MIKLTPEKPPYYENTGPIKTYKALLTQTGTNAPVINQIITNTIGEITTEYALAGTYYLTSQGLFRTGKTAIYIGNTATAGAIDFTATPIDDNTVQIMTIQNGNPTNGHLTLTPVTIEVKY